MKTEEKYKGYFSSRGVAPSMYKDAKLPYYLENVFPLESSILDIGCGFGQNMSALRKAGYTKVRGLDVSAEAVAYCKEQGLPVEQGDVMSYAGSRYDYVLMSHVLEHLPKDSIIPALKKIRKDILAEHGAICIMVPNDIVKNS